MKRNVFPKSERKRWSTSRSVAHRRSRLRRVLETALLLSLLAVLLPAIASAQSLSGHVSGPDGSGLPGVCVQIDYVPSGSTSYTVADVNGNYAIALPSGSYTVTFVPWAVPAAFGPGGPGCPGTSGNYAPQCYNGKHQPNCDVVMIDTSRGSTVVNATLAIGGQISGHVTDTRDRPLAGICVSEEPLPASVLYLDTRARVPSTQTDANGNYTLIDLRTGASYGVGFSDCHHSVPRYADQCYNGKKGLLGADPGCRPDPVSVTEGTMTAGINAVMSDFLFAGLPLTSQKITVAKNGKVVLSLPCPAATAGSCAGTDTLKTTGPVAANVAAKRKRHNKRRVLTLGSARFSIPAGDTGKVTIKLSKAARKLLAKKHTLKVLEVVVAHDSRGTTKTSSAKVKLKARKK
jgi:hypothetical protein